MKGLRVLVADDEALTAMELERVLESFGCELVGTVSRVSEIAPAVERSRPDAAILDINLAGERSYAAAAALRAAGVPVIFVTGYGRLFGCPPEVSDVPHIEKPFSETQIRSALGEALERRR